MLLDAAILPLLLREGEGVCVYVFGTRWEDAKYGSVERIALLTDMPTIIH